MQPSGVTAVDSVFQWTGYKLAAIFHDTLWTGLFVLLPASIWLASALLTIWRCIREHDYHDIPVYLGYSLVILWVIWPVQREYGMVIEANGPAAGEYRTCGEYTQRALSPVSIRMPRLLGWMSGVLDQFVVHATLEIEARTPQNLRDFAHAASLVELVRIRDPRTLTMLKDFVSVCYAPALAYAEEHKLPVADPHDLMYDPALLETYQRLVIDDDGRTCAWMRDQIERGIRQDEHHIAVMQRLRRFAANGNFDELYIARVVRNTLTFPDRGPGGIPTVSLAYTYLRPASSEGFTFREFSSMVNVINPPALATDPSATWASAEQAWKRLLGALGETVADMTAAQAKNLFGYTIVTHVTALAPAFYGLVLMIVLAIFPLIAVWALLPGKAVFFFRYFKILAGVKLWPVFWTVVSSFYNSGGLEGVLTGEQKAPDALFVAASMYLLVPVICVGVVELSASFASMSLATLGKVAGSAASAATGASVGVVLSGMNHIVSSLGRVALGLAGSVASSAGRGAGVVPGPAPRATFGGGPPPAPAAPPSSR